MLAKILAVLWILFGTIWMFNPLSLKNWLQKKMTRRMWRVVFFFLLVFGVVMIGSVLKSPGLMSKVVAVIGLVVSIKAIMFITSKTGEKFVEWLDQRSVLFFRVFAGVIVAVGVMLFYS